MKKTNKISAYIIAGGRSSRMGFDKGLHIFQRKEMIMHIIETLQSVNCDIVINSNNQEYKKFGYPVINDIIKDVGPAGGLYSALFHSKTEYNLILPCDAPFINLKIINLLLGNKDKASIVVPKHPDGKIEPMIALYRKSVIKPLVENINAEKFSLITLINQCRSFMLPLEDYLNQSDYRCLTNINTRRELVNNEAYKNEEEQINLTA